MSKESLHRAVVVRLDSGEVPVETFEVVCGPSSIAVLRRAHEFARQRSHEDTEAAYAVVTVREDGSYLDRKMTAGLARVRLLPTRLPVGALAGLAL